MTKNPPGGQPGLPAGQVGKLSKYLLYAIGEIILVVLGILIALQINNWNQSKIKDAKEMEILGLMKDITKEIERLENK